VKSMYDGRARGSITMQIAMIKVFSEDGMRRPTPHTQYLMVCKSTSYGLTLVAQMKGGSAHYGW
jgi:hypothetical protein